MGDVNYTLFQPISDNHSDEYYIQIATDFNAGNWTYNGFEITQIPEQVGEVLKVKLRFKKGTDNHVVHDFPIGDFPNHLASWILEIEFIDENGAQIRNSEIGILETRSRPLKGDEDTQIGMPRPPKK